MHSPGKIKNVKKKIHARAKRVLLHGIGNFVWASGSEREKIGGSRKKFSDGEGRAEGRVRFRRKHGSAELGDVACGSATQGLWLRDRKVRSQVVGENRSRFPGKRTVGEVRRGRRRASERAKKRVYRFRIRFGRERGASHLPCLSPGLGDDRQSTSESGDVSLAIFITSVSGSESLESFTNCTFHFSKPPGFRMAFDTIERNGKFGRI